VNEARPLDKRVTLLPETAPPGVFTTFVIDPGEWVARERLFPGSSGAASGVPRET